MAHTPPQPRRPHSHGARPWARYIYIPYIYAHPFYAFDYTPAAASGTLRLGLALLARERRLTAAFLLWAVAITGGTTLIMQLVSDYSAVTAVSVTSVRKAATLVASFVLFPKPLGWGHVAGALCVFRCGRP